MKAVAGRRGTLARLFEYAWPYWRQILGIAILIAAAIIMPVLAKAKRKLSAATGSAALRADAAQSATCAYLSVIAFVGLVANAVWHVAWADPLAALAIVPFVVWEGREAMQSRPCGCF